MDAPFALGAESANVNPALPSRLPGIERSEDRRFSLFLFFTAIVLGIVLESYGPAGVQAAFNTIKLDSLSCITALLTALVASIVLHESGHLLAAIALKFHILSICIGPLRLRHSYGKWQIQNSGRIFIGSISAIPRTNDCWRAQVLTVVAGGPILTLTTGLTAYLLLSHGSLQPWPKTFLGSLVQLSLFLFLLGLIPNSRTAPVRNDARLFAILWTDSAEAREIFLYHLVTRLEVEGIRPRDYPLALIRTMAGAQGRPDIMLVCAHFICMWALDQGDSATALAWDEWQLQLSKQVSEAASQAALARSGCLDVLLQNDFESASKKLSSVDIDSLSPVWLRHRTKAAYALAIGNFPETLAETCRGQQSFPARLPLFEFERTLLGRLHRQALAAMRPKEIARAKTSHAA